jgi:para-aminobenzoate synthetase component 1
VTAAWDITEVTWPADIVAAVAAFAGGAELAWLDSCAAEAAPCCSLGCARPRLWIEQFEGQPAVVRGAEAGPSAPADGWRLWRTAWQGLARLPQLPWSIGPGWVGYIGFEMARYLERLPGSRREDLGLPLLRLGLFERGVVLDHAARRAFAVRAVGLDVAGAAVPARDGDWIARWESAAGARREFAPTGLPRWRPEVERTAYERSVQRALEYIAAGDIYQVNLAQRLRIEGVGDPLAAYARVREVNPAPYAALLRWDAGAVLSHSPELFLRVRGRAVLTSPIKGTRPRVGDEPLDDARQTELLASAKERAELAMIVDLHRNDLGRVCRYGSVRVVQPRRLEAHPTVFHTVADVVGELAPGADALALLAACFPAGSITGVPKIRAMQIIDELEPVARGAYTGAVGVLGLDGQMTFNVAIRTLQVRGSTATLYVGGGIVADSDPAAEYEETRAKGRGIIAGLTGAERVSGAAGGREPVASEA